jgi:hypothetical protein
MAWFFLIVLLVCAIAFPRFRKVLLWVVAILAGIVVVFLVWDRSKQATSKKLIAPSEIELVDVQLQGGSSTNNYNMIGRVRNHSSQYTLSDFSIKVTLEDCFNGTACDVIYQEDRSAFPGLVPPGQARDFDISGIGNYDMRLKGSLRWHYALTEVRGRE